MQIAKIPKKSGGFRTIYKPDPKERRRCVRLIVRLNALLEIHCRPLPCHGFMPNRSPVTNAQAHIGFAWSLSFDLKDFFDSVTAWHVDGIVPEQWYSRVFYDGAARQGLPTSPLVANLGASGMDRDILAKLEDGVVYTRYADDLTFSSNDRAKVEVIKTWLEAVLTQHRFQLNHKKTRLQWAGFGRRVITGIAVDDQGLHPTRSVRRRLRAALHQDNQPQARGLAEWCRLQPPGPVSNRERRRQANAAKRSLLRM